MEEKVCLERKISKRKLIKSMLGAYRMWQEGEKVCPKWKKKHVGGIPREASERKSMPGAEN